MTAHDPALVAQAWHDVTCPEGPDCRDRLLHSLGQPLAYSGVLARFLDRLAELEKPAPPVEYVASDVCAHPIRVDGPGHSWSFDGDDPYIVCAGCGELRDALTGRVIRPGQVRA